MKFKRALIITTVLSIQTLAARGAPTAPQYTVVDLGTLSGGNASQCYGINNSGQVTGESSTTNGVPGFFGSHAFLYSGGSMTDLGVLGGNLSYGGAASGGSGVNDAGQVSGSSAITNGSATHGFLYSSGGMNDLGTLGDPSQVGKLGGPDSYGFGINNSGQVTGYSTIVNGSGNHAFLYSSGRLSDLGTLGGSSSYGYGINDSAQVVGESTITGESATHAFLYSGAGMSDLGTLGGTSSHGYAINNSGLVTGSSDFSGGGYHAFLYSTNGGMSDLGTVGGTSSIGRGVNGSGQIVGDSYIRGNSADHAFLYSGGAMNDLNNLVSKGQMADFSYLQVARGVNDHGWIAGNGVTTNGAMHPFLAIPVQISALTKLPNGHIHLQCQGVPNRVYRIEASADLSANSFSTLASISSDPTGAFQFEDLNVALIRFYQIAYP